MARKKLTGKRLRKVSEKTLLIAGEGPVEKAFLSHLCDLFRAEGLAVKIVPASGGSPLDILKEAKSRKHADHDHYFALIDTDVPIDDQALAYARKEKITIITSSPVCLECMLLQELGHRVKHACACEECKKQLYPLLKGRHTQKESYNELFSKQTLQSFKHPAIKDLIALLENTNRENDQPLIRKIQEALTTLGYFSATIDGKLSDKTKAAIKTVQKSMKLYDNAEPSEGLLALLKDRIRNG